MSDKKYPPSQAKYNKMYDALHKKRIGITLYDTNPESVELIEVWQSIPNKTEFFKQCLRDYRDKGSPKALGE